MGVIFYFYIYLLYYIIYIIHYVYYIYLRVLRLFGALTAVRTRAVVLGISLVRPATRFPTYTHGDKNKNTFFLMSAILIKQYYVLCMVCIKKKKRCVL